MIDDMNEIKHRIRVGHSPDPDDAFMFHALANDKIDTLEYQFEHELVDIETLNQRAISGELELTARVVAVVARSTERSVTWWRPGVLPLAMAMFPVLQRFQRSLCGAIR